MVAQPSASPLWFEVLGPVRGRREGLDLDLGSGKQRAVLAVLLLHRNTPVTTARIVEAVWGDDPPLNGTNVVQKYVAGLRRTLEPAREARAPGHLLSLDAAGYTLAVGPDQLDLDAFERLRRSGLRHRAEGRPEQALRTLRDAADLVAAEPLAGLPGDWFAAARARVVEEWTDTLEACVELEVELGRSEQALPEVRGLVARFPLRERLRAALMLALYRSGRPAEALAAFQATREHLVETLGVDPGPALQDLHARMLRSDPGLLPAGATVRPGRDGASVLSLVPPLGSGDHPPPAVPPAVPPAAPPAVPPPHGTPPVSWTPPPPPAATSAGRTHPAPARRSTVAAWVLLALAVLVTLGTLGIGTPVALLVVGTALWSRDRRRATGVAAGLLVAWLVGFVLTATTPQNTPASVVGVVLLLVAALATTGLSAYALLGPGALRR